MLKTEITIHAPDLIAALNAFTNVLLNASPTPAQHPAVFPAAPTPAPVVPTVTQSAQPQPPDAPPQAAPTPPAAPPAVPVAPAPTYTSEQIMTAGAALVDAGKMNELMGLLNAFGVQAVTQLMPGQLGAFATEMRKLGAQI